MKVLSLFKDISVLVSEKGEIYTLDHDYLRKNGQPESRKGKKLKSATDKRAVKIEFNGVIYNSIREASRKTGFSQTMIIHHGKKVAV